MENPNLLGENPEMGKFEKIEEIEISLPDRRQKDKAGNIPYIKGPGVRGTIGKDKYFALNKEQLFRIAKEEGSWFEGYATWDDLTAEMDGFTKEQARIRKQRTAADRFGGDKWSPERNA
jgi:hypothetical protein